MYFGRIVTNSTTGPTIAANFAFEKKTEIKKDSVISDMWNRKKKRKRRPRSEFGRKVAWEISVDETDIQKKVMNAVKNHDS